MDTHSAIRSASLIVVAMAFAVMAFASLLIAREVQDLGDKAERDRACAVHWILYDLVVEGLDAFDSASGFDDPEEALEEALEEVQDRMEYLADQCMPEPMRQSRNGNGWR